MTSRSPSERRRLKRFPLGTVAFRHGTKAQVRAFAQTQINWVRAQSLAPTRAPTVGDIHWAAGFLEADGCFSKTRPSGKISASQKHREPLDRLQDIFGGTVYKRQNRGRVFYEWCLGPTMNRAREVVRLLLLTDRLSPRRRDQIRRRFGDEVFSTNTLTITEQATPNDFRWAAGLWEGDGSCGGSSQVNIPQKNRWVLDRVRTLFGGHVGPCSYRFQWSISGAKARVFIQSIYGELSSRRKIQVKKHKFVG